MNERTNEGTTEKVGLAIESQLNRGVGSSSSRSARALWFLAVAVGVRGIGWLVSQSLALILSASARHQGRVVVEGFAHLVANYVHQGLEYRL